MMERRKFLRVATLGALAYACPYDGLGEEKPQKFKIGMAATTWLATDHSTAMYWKAVEAISQLGIGATEADNSDAHLDSAYGADPLHSLPGLAESEYNWRASTRHCRCTSARAGTPS